MHRPFYQLSIYWMLMQIVVHHPPLVRPPTTRGNKCNYSFRCPEHIVVGILIHVLVTLNGCHHTMNDARHLKMQ